MQLPPLPRRAGRTSDECGRACGERGRRVAGEYTRGHAMTPRRAYDLTTLAPNGLRRGYTTGTCATAAVKAAAALLLRGARMASVEVSLPDPDYFLTVPVRAVDWSAHGVAHAEVVKDGGDDPDNTHGATLFSDVSVNHCRALRFFAGRGVGVVTRPGLRVNVGEPAINPVPRQMIRRALDEVLDGDADPGFDVSIGCIGGEAIAKKTFNPRLGIVGGISILGTSGIVEPMSVAAWVASIEVYVRVALSDAAAQIAFTPGKIGRDHARDVLGLPDTRVVQIANFIGPSLDFAQQALAEDGRRLEVLWVLGHPGKLAKVLDGYWDTHSSHSTMAMPAVARIAAQYGVPAECVGRIEQANTVENVVEILRSQPLAAVVWREIERRVAALMQQRVPRARVEVRLFDMQGVPLGAAA